ncbi:MAG: hypothetical protein R8P61_02345 [Bacteroidia bacterium]|nr:hypothetical protein [Bacteroidia bacterium]
MSYVLHAIVAKEAVLDRMLSEIKAAKKINLEQGFAMIPVNGKLADIIDPASDSECIADFIMLTDAFEERVLEILKEEKWAYLESEFFGGRGGHMGIVWEEGKRKMEISESYTGANELLREIGVRRTSHLDEFDCMGLGRHRSVDDWLEENP